MLRFPKPSRLLVVYHFFHRARRRQPPHYQIVHAARQARAVAGDITNATDRWDERMPETMNAITVLFYSLMRSTSKLSTDVIDITPLGHTKTPCRTIGTRPTNRYHEGVQASPFSRGGGRSTPPAPFTTTTPFLQLHD
ncbi:unnamed protein product [Ectocarpus sp. 4 AP-2014]